MPKPKVKAPEAGAKGEAQGSEGEAKGDDNDGDYDLSAYAGMGDTGTQGHVEKMQELNELDAKHDYYADELSKIKAMLL